MKKLYLVLFLSVSILVSLVPTQASAYQVGIFNNTFTDVIVTWYSYKCGYGEAAECFRRNVKANGTVYGTNYNELDPTFSFPEGYDTYISVFKHLVNGQNPCELQDDDPEKKACLHSNVVIKSQPDGIRVMCRIGSINLYHLKDWPPSFACYSPEQMTTPFK
ncbi:hypothetical protein bplSymb_SCF14801P001 [Bathymodiolus platifrons methanotrophic gill symbiont]|uniref:hypothetical protein n=1 Tax=Bathymodiolus platifrons methanotrophic gill symbiont TaxID=113268 RepID=UPI000B40EAA4|nr:hypothetical protein [Bathymodiolus platifrons methanotrophic gill symbiont]GAW87726.1 hypothetical protein bplSymb_SCF14801P001 [Bathymodiolus platifrons methanotrophic gill symbiont]GFO76633.1 hypothetical protein BPLS_P4546 [Bathymodiolus platifrons methanotrophic gill symbiont]